MKWSFANVSLLIFGFFGILIVTFFNELTVSNEQDYYTLKDAVEASMFEAVDVTYFRLTGSIKINQEKFVENLTRRFSEVATFGEGNYNLEFYQISESPPKVSVRVVDATNSYNIFGTFGTDPTQINIVNEVTAIMDVYDNNKGVVSFADLNLVNTGNGSDKVFKYKNKYYRLDSDFELPSHDSECKIYDNTIQCYGGNGKVNVLNLIDDIIENTSISKEVEFVDSTCISLKNGIIDEDITELQALDYANNLCMEQYKEIYDSCTVDRVQLGDFDNWLIYYKCLKSVKLDVVN